MALGLDKRARRRSDVLATVRRVIGERGYAAATMRELAREGGVTVATLYNQFGSKNGLIVAAVEDLFRSAVDPAVGAEQARGFDRVMLAAQRAANVADVDSAFPRAIAVALASTPHATEMRTAFSRMHHDQMIQGVEEMMAAGELEPWVDCEGLADVILLETAGATHLWAEVERSGEWRRTGAWLRSRCALGASMALLGVARGPVRERIMAMTKALHADVAQERCERHAGTGPSAG